VEGVPEVRQLTVGALAGLGIIAVLSGGMLGGDGTCDGLIAGGSDALAYGGF